MAWSTPPTFTDGVAITASQLNKLVADLNETAVAKATTAGSYYVASGTNVLAERSLQNDYVSTSETTTSTSATDLATPGPTVSIATGVKALVFLTAAIFNNTADKTSAMGLDISGASSLSASAAISLRWVASTANAGGQASIALPIALTAGTNVFTAKYFVSSGSTGTFQFRRMIVLPF